LSVLEFVAKKLGNFFGVSSFLSIFAPSKINLEGFKILFLNDLKGLIT
jgi:hypothetical protein